MTRAEFITLIMTLTQQTREQVTTLQAQLNVQAMTIQKLLNTQAMTSQKLLDKATIFKAETVTLKAENTALVNAQKQSIHVLSEESSTYAAIAKMLLNSCLSNILPVSSESIVSSTYTDTSYCTINISQANAAEKTKANSVTVREAIKKEICKQQGKEN